MWAGSERVVIVLDPHMRGETDGPADLRARSSTSWMFTARRSGGRTLPNSSTCSSKLQDAACFLDDQVGQLALLAIGVHRDELRRPSDARERVLDLVGQHLGHADSRFRGRFRMHRAVEPAGELAILQKHEHMVGLVRQGGDLDVAGHRLCGFRCRRPRRSRKARSGRCGCARTPLPAAHRQRSCPRRDARRATFSTRSERFLRRGSRRGCDPRHRRSAPGQAATPRGDWGELGHAATAVRAGRRSRRAEAAERRAARPPSGWPCAGGRAFRPRPCTSPRCLRATRGPRTRP